MKFRDWAPLSSVSNDLLNETRLIHVFSREVFLVTKNDEVLACGTNDSGCLGLSDTAPRFSPESVAALQRKRVKGFVFGGEYEKLFVIAHCFTGAIYTWGKNHGTGDVNPILRPTLMDQITKKVLEVACGMEHCLLLNIDGEVFGWGGNSGGQVGNSSQKRIAAPTRIEKQLAGKFVAKISCGSYFSAAVLDSGKVFTWGDNERGQLGLNASEDCYLVPMEILHLNDTIIKKIICGATYMLAVNDVCELYVWGSHDFGELGLGDFGPRLIPVKNETVGRVLNIAASYNSLTSAALTENFKVLMWGNCSGLNIAVPKETLYESLHEVFANFSSPCLTYKSMTRQSGYESVNETLKSAFGDKETSDLTIMAEGKKIFVHRAILRLRSDYFRTFLQEHWLTETEKCVDINQSYNAMYAYLEYLYCGELTAEPKLALELLALADEYNDRPLKRLCEKTIQHGITIDNVAELYAIALKLNGKKLLKSCLSFAANHVSELIDTSGFNDWDLETMREFFRECRKRKLFRS